MSNIDLYIEGSCKTNELDIPTSAQIQIYYNYKQECIKLAKDETRTWI